MSGAVFTSGNNDWNTPADFYQELDREFNFTFDPCPNDPEIEGLMIPWGESNFVNPPYTTKLQDAFANKALIEHTKGNTVVMLVPARTSTKRFHKIFLPYASEIRFIQGRLHFINPVTGVSPGPAPFDSMLVIFNGKQ